MIGAANLKRKKLPDTFYLGERVIVTYSRGQGAANPTTACTASSTAATSTQSIARDRQESLLISDSGPARLARLYDKRYSRSAV